jgi:hypothetical protein
MNCLVGTADTVLLGRVNYEGFFGCWPAVPRNQLARRALHCDTPTTSESPSSATPVSGSTWTKRLRADSSGQTLSSNSTLASSLATGPKQVWSWDTTKLLGPVKWSYFHAHEWLTDGQHGWKELAVRPGAVRQAHGCPGDRANGVGSDEALYVPPNGNASCRGITICMRLGRSTGTRD